MTPNVKTKQLFSWGHAQTVGAQQKPHHNAFVVKTGTCGSRPFLIAAVAGAGASDPTAKPAAERAAFLFRDYILTTMDDCAGDRLEVLVRAAVATVRQSLLHVAKCQSIDVGACPTTLHGVVTTGLDTVIIKIGGGGTIVGTPWHPVFPPTHADTAAPQFITDADALEKARIIRINRPVRFLALFSQSVEDAVIHPGTSIVHTPMFDEAAFGFTAEENWPDHRTRVSETLSRGLLNQAPTANCHGRTIIAVHCREIAA